MTITNAHFPRVREEFVTSITWSSFQTSKKPKIAPVGCQYQTVVDRMHFGNIFYRGNLALLSKWKVTILDHERLRQSFYGRVFTNKIFVKTKHRLKCDSRAAQVNFFVHKAKQFSVKLNCLQEKESDQSEACVHKTYNRYETRYPSTTGREFGERFVMLLNSLLHKPL